MTLDPDVVLVVDDDLAVRDSLKFALEIEGLRVHACAGGPELLAHPALRAARCVVLDYKMPVMDGLSVIDRLARQNVRVPVILITGHATDALRRRAVEAGVRHILEKPLLDSALVDSIQDVIGTHSTNTDFMC
jgi:two-component system response regulator FixJ